MRKVVGIFLAVFFYSATAFSQNISGTVLDENREPIIGANVIIKGTSNGTTTDFDGKFILKTGSQTFPVNLEISFIGYQTQTVSVKNANQKIEVQLGEDAEMLGEVSIIEQRLSEKQQNSALTVEALDGLAIKETPAANFYEALGNLKGVDLTSASIGFKIINTRGFNSTSPVRSLQIIDGVDNQAPGLNFSLGNFLGASELDVRNVDIIAGASTAFYGPGAFNGVISMTTKNPFDYQGLSASVKVGERNLTETAVRYAEGFRVGITDYENLAFKINLFYLRADDWEATNYRPIDDSDVPADNPGGYDAVNIYGDEDLAGGNDSRFDLSGVYQPNSTAGLGKFYRTGYREPDLVDYDTRNFKGNLQLAYRFTPDLELSYQFNYGTGTTVYQGENRFSLKDIQFFQNVVELKKKDKFFVRAYATNEDAGNSYDAVLTAFKMNEALHENSTWNQDYKRFYVNDFKFGNRVRDNITGLFNLAAFPPAQRDSVGQWWLRGPYQDSLQKYNATVSGYHGEVRGILDSLFHPEPGSAAFDSLFNYITSRTFTEGGSRFYDRSALYHAMGEYQFDPIWQLKFRAGGNFRLYLPDSRGNIFDEIVDTTIIEDEMTGQEISREYGYRQIRNYEYGAYLGAERAFWGDNLKLAATLRMDKNQNFDYLFSPAFSAVWVVDEKNTVRFSLSKGIRNPTLADQYLRYDVGRAILLGNLNGFDSLVTLESFDAYRNNSAALDSLEYFNVAPIQPEQVVTVEAGYRATFFKRLYFDINGYYNWYRNFIGFQFGLDLEFDQTVTNFLTDLQAYRISANAPEQVKTYGANLGLNYYLTDELSLNGNYSYNQIDLEGSDNPIIPAYNTPRHKYNLGVTGRGYKPFSKKDHTLGFAATYKWVEGFRFEGSPQFSGFIPSYGLVDAQVSYQIPKIYSTFKLGASNLLNNEVFQVYGGPSVGRLAYFSVLFEWN